MHIFFPLRPTDTRGLCRQAWDDKCPELDPINRDYNDGLIELTDMMREFHEAHRVDEADDIIPAEPVAVTQ